jgi:hypothetical protein
MTEQQEKMFWKSAWLGNGNLTAVYKRGTEEREVRIVPETAKTDAFEAAGHTFTTTSRLFKIEKADLQGWLPKHGDTLTCQDKTYIVKKTRESETLFLDVGNHGVVIRIFVSEYRN